MHIDNFDALLYSLEKFENKKIVIFGAGSCGKKFYFELKFFEQNVSFFVDNNSSKWGNLLFGKKICSPEKLLDENPDNIAIFVASIYKDEISNQLVSMGFELNKNFFYFISGNANIAEIGRHTYINQNILNHDFNCYIKSIGSFCSIAESAIIGPSNHCLDLLTTHLFPLEIVRASFR